MARVVLVMFPVALLSAGIYCATWGFLLLAEERVACVVPLAFAIVLIITAVDRWNEAHKTEWQRAAEASPLRGVNKRAA
jgi:hypothetical protein